MSENQASEQVETVQKTMEQLAEEADYARRKKAIAAPIMRSGQNPDSLGKAAAELGRPAFRVKARVLKECPRCMYYKLTSGRLLLRNRPAFFAWWFGFGVGKDAVEAWRAKAYAEGKTELALELEHRPTRFYRTSERIATMVAEQVAGRGGEDDDE